MKKRILAIIVSVVLGFTFAAALCVRALFLPVSASSGENMKIVLDAGHGGIDGGVTGKRTGVKESEVNLAICLKLKAKLDEYGFDVTLTRRTDAGLYGTTAPGFKRRDMQKRKEIIERENPLLVVSVHQNFFPSGKERGGQVFYEKGNADGKRLADGLQAKLNALYETEGVKNRKVSSGDYYMLHMPVPSVIVECGFLSNAVDEALLVSDVFQGRLAGAICAGVVAYLADAQT